MARNNTTIGTDAKRAFLGLESTIFGLETRFPYATNQPTSDGLTTCCDGLPPRCDDLQPTLPVLLALVS